MRMRKHNPPKTHTTRGAHLELLLELLLLLLCKLLLGLKYKQTDKSRYG
jgi:hypothetical protein